MNIGWSSSKSAGTSKSVDLVMPPSLHVSQYVSIRPLPCKHISCLSAVQYNKCKGPYTC
jgi:hypothetical protein